MLASYLTSLLRYFGKNRTFTLINLSGLVAGIVACLLITQFVWHEYSYDGFHENKHRLFRLQLDRYNQGERSTRWAAGALGIGPDLKANFPEVERMVMMTPSNAMLSHDDVYFREEHIYYASAEFFRMFSIPLIEGVDSLVLKDPFTVVLSQSLARKYFGNENPIGKTITNNGRTDFKVTGIFEDLPANTHMHFDALFSFESWLSLVRPRTPLSWQWDGFLTYILLSEGTDPIVFEAKLPAYVLQREGEELKRWDAGMVFNLQPITDIHLDSDFIMEFKANGSRQTAYFLSLVAGLILFIAWINYINLSTAKSIERAREVGLRKVLGGVRGQLIRQFLFESWVFNTLAVVVAAGLCLLLMPWFSELTGRPLGYGLFTELRFWFALAALIVLGSVGSGLYPALVLSGYQPVTVLKGRFSHSSRGLYLRKGMVITQFIASIALMVGTYTVYRQLSYMRSQSLGVAIDQTLVLRTPNVTDSTYQFKFEGFKQRMLQYPEVKAVAASSSVPGSQADWNAGGIRLIHEPEDAGKQYRVIMMDHDFIPAFGLQVVAGRAFTAGTPNEPRSVLLNESGAQQLGFDEYELALDQYINFWGDTFRIVGVVKDYHHESLKKAYDPMVFRYSPSPGRGFYSVKFNTASVHESMDRLRNHWQESFSGNSFDYFFLDDHYNKQYKADQQFGTVFGLFTALAMFIACLGLFGLSSLTVLQRTKEIGVRKVMGATVAGILQLISWEYILLLSIAIVLAVPLAWWIMSGWLSEFAYAIPLGWTVFVLPCLAVVVVALATISVHIVRAAQTNPVNSLRHE